MGTTALHALLVEDDPGDARLVRELLRDGPSVRLTHVARLAEAVRELAARTFDIVLLDLGLPDSWGLDTLVEVLAVAPCVPIVVLTGQDDDRTGRAAVRRGAQDFLVKGRADDHALQRALLYAVERNEHQARLVHLNSVLRAVRNVNQLIVREKDPRQLVEQACRLLVDARGYHAAWIALLGDRPMICAEAGLGPRFETMRAHLQDGALPECCAKALSSSEVIVVSGPRTSCATCPLAECTTGHGSLTCRLENGGTTYGVLSVNLPSDFASDEEETSLVSEIAGDIAFALRGIETEGERRRIEQALRDSEHHLREAQRLGRIGHWIYDVPTEHIEWSDTVHAIYRRPPALGPPSEAEESRYYSPEDAARLRTCATRAIESGQPFEIEVSVCRMDGTSVNVAATGQPVTDSEGRVVRLLGTVQDITERKQAEQALRAEKELSDAIIRTAQTFILLLDPAGRVQLLNPYAEAVSGYPLADVKGKDWFDNFLPERTREATRALFERALGGVGTTGNTDTIITRDGVERAIEWHDKVLSDEVGRTVGLLCVGQDVTAREEAEVARRRAQRETEALLHCTRMLLESTDFGNTARGIFDEMSQFLGATAGYLALRSEDGGQNELLFLESGGLPCTVDLGLPMPIRGLRAEAYARGQAVFENQFSTSVHAGLLPQGHVDLGNVLFVPLLADERAVGMFGLANKPGGFTVQDARSAGAFAEIAAIALREERTRAALAESEELYRRLFETSRDALMTLEPPSWRFTSGNEASIKMFGCHDLWDFAARTPWEYSPPMQPDGRPSRDTALAMIEVAMTHGSHHFDWQHRTQDGREFPATVLLTRVEVGGRSFLQATVRDMTDRNKMRAQLAQADRLSSMGMLAAGVAHEINNPLSYILYNLESLTNDLPVLLDAIRRYQARLDDHGGPEVIEETVGEGARQMHPTMLNDIEDRFRDAIDGTRRIGEIARGLATFSRVERDQLVPVDLKYVIEAALNMCFNEIKYRARVVKDYGQMPPVLASEGRLSQVFLNLFVNAAHAIGEGNVESNEIRVRTWVEGNEACAEVRDTGRGIAPEHMDKLFEPFFTTKEIGVGSGLGLSISKGIVEGYGGTITVYSEVGKGTVFTVRLPLRATDAPRAAAAAAAEEEGVQGRVLIVDDDDCVRAALGRILRSYDKVMASNGEVARKVLEKDQAFDVIVCDMMMPQFSGADLHEWLVAAHPRLAKQLIFITGGTFTPRAREYLARVSNPRIEKPFDVANFKKIVADTIRLARK